MVEMTPPPMWLQPVGTATRDVTGEINRYLLSSIASTWFRNCIKGAGIGCIDWPAATQGRLYLVTTGSYLAPKFNGGNSASNLKAPLSTACPNRPHDEFMGNDRYRERDLVLGLGARVRFTPNTGLSRIAGQKIREKSFKGRLPKNSPTLTCP